jgi:hypothetical protein
MRSAIHRRLRFFLLVLLVIGVFSESVPAAPAADSAIGGRTETPASKSHSIPLGVNSGEGTNRDGKLLRSELWRPFDARSAKGDFFVSTEGNDDWSGTLAAPDAAHSDGPFATLTRARRAVRELKRKVYLPKEKAIDARYVGTAYPFGKGRDIVVFIRQGFYSLGEPLLFTPEDGGERVETTLPSGAFEWHHLRDNYVTYSAYPGEKPVISGAVLVTAWKKAGTVWEATPPGKEVSALIANGRKQTLARTPNSGYFTLRKHPSSSLEIPFKPGDIRSWGQMQDNRVVILLRWRTAYNAIDRIDEQNQIAFLKQPEDGPGGHNGLLVVPPRYYIENIQALLDAPGEWFFDKTTQKISYIPSEGVGDPNKANLSVPQINQLLQVKGEENRPVRNLRFYGLILEGARDNFRDFPHHYEPTPGCTAITLDYAYDCEFARSELRACGGIGMSIGQGCFNTRIFDNTFDGLEQGAIGVSGAGDLQSGKLVQVTRETRIDHNVFTECGHGGGITLGVGNALHTTIAHNYFTKSGRPYTIDCGGGGLEGNINADCVVEYNHFEDVQNDADDAGVIVVNGMTFNSAVRNNLIHKVHRGFFSDNVAFWFDNMSSNWQVRNNVFYDLEQAEMKTCGTYLIDNDYSDNFSIEPPRHPPERFIEGDPSLVCSDLSVTLDGSPVVKPLDAGSIVQIRADVTNDGSSGVAPVALYVDRKVVEMKPFPIIKGNTRAIEFQMRLNSPGAHEISIGDTQPKVIVVRGGKPTLSCEKIEISEERVLAGERVRVTARIVNLQAEDNRSTIGLYANGRQVESQPIALGSRESKLVAFDIDPEAGSYRLRVGNSADLTLIVLKSKELNLKQERLYTYVSPKAEPASVEVHQGQNAYTIKASGWDFYHAEDAYATVFRKQLPGDFVSTAKIVGFGDRTSEWYRSGLFARNDICRSFDVDRGSPGSVLMFCTPGRAGIEYDEFRDGCMHKAASENLPEHTPTPIWVRLERHGNRFTGSVSLDGKTWMIHRRTTPIPGVGKAVDLGLAAGAPDQKQYTVRFEEWKIRVAAE